MTGHRCVLDFNKTRLMCTGLKLMTLLMQDMTDVHGY